MSSARFEVDVTPESALDFARLSGDWNPLHTDDAHAQATPYRRRVLHGAFSAGLVSRMAGMFLPGTDCLLHGMRLRFLAPIIPPSSLLVDGKIISDSGSTGRVDVVISDCNSGVRYVDASYEFGRHESGHLSEAKPAHVAPGVATSEPVILVTGGSGGLGSAVITAVGPQAIGLSRMASEGCVQVANLESDADLAAAIPAGSKVSAIVHCAWPSPDNQPLTSLADIAAATEHFVSAPLRQMLTLAKLLRTHGTEDAALVLVGSSFAQAGRHNFRMPLYSLGKSMIPTLTHALAVELGAHGQRCIGISYDVIDAGMNQRMTRSSRAAHAGRTPSGVLPTAVDAAAQVAWVLGNRSNLLSGAMLSLTGGALP